MPEITIKLLPHAEVHGKPNAKYAYQVVMKDISGDDDVTQAIWLADSEEELEALMKEDYLGEEPGEMEEAMWDDVWNATEFEQIGEVIK